MNVVIAIDSFKGSISSIEAGNAAAEGILRVFPKARILVRPLADGGEGTVKALTDGCGGSFQSITVTGPSGKPVVSEYGILADGKTAVLEMSSAAGITLVDDSERNPLFTTTYGVGELIKNAVAKGCRRFIVGIGGSATNDGGAGMLQALGFEFLDFQGRQISPDARGLAELVSISSQKALPELSACSFRIACDVTNPLCGPLGCSQYPHADPDAAGSGAAGGVGFAFRTFLGGHLEPGVKMILEETHLEDHIRQADFVLTGEGCLDGQTIMGKAPIGVAEIAAKYRKPVIALAGSVTPDAAACCQSGISAFFPIVRGVTSLSAAMEPENAKRNMADTAEQIFRVVKVCG